MAVFQTTHSANTAGVPVLPLLFVCRLRATSKGIPHPACCAARPCMACHLRGLGRALGLQSLARRRREAEPAEALLLPAGGLQEKVQRAVPLRHVGPTSGFAHEGAPRHTWHVRAVTLPAARCTAVRPGCVAGQCTPQASLSPGEWRVGEDVHGGRSAALGTLLHRQVDVLLGVLPVWHHAQRQQLRGHVRRMEEGFVARVSGRAPRQAPRPATAAA